MNIPPMDVQQSWLDYIYQGTKTVEGRTGPLGKYDNIVGSVIDLYDPANEEFRFPVKIVEVRHYDTLDEYIDAEGWRSIAPHTGSNAETRKAYASIYMLGAGGERVQVFSPERVQARGGINAIEVKKV